MKKHFLYFMAFILGVGIILGGGQVVFAQEDSDEAFTLEEIIVTSEKREVNVQDTAMSVTAVTGADIRDQALNTIGEVMKNLAGVQVASSIQGGQIYIRGIGAYGGEPATAVMLDDVYSGRALTVKYAMYDVGRVEVLRGPQGTLYGRNATGGIVNVVSRQPVLDEFELLGNLQIGDYNLMHFDGAINIPLSEKVAGRVALLRETRDGYISDGSGDANVFSTRIRLLYQPNNNLSIMGNYDYSWEDSHGNNTLPIEGSAGNLPPFFPWVDPDIPVDGWAVPAGADEWENDPWHPAGTLYNTREAYSLKIDWDLGWGQMTLIPSHSEEYRHNRDDMLAGISTRPSGAYGDGQYFTREQSSVEARLASTDESAFTWMIGYYGMKNDQPPETDPQDPTTYDDASWHFVTYRDPDITHAFFGQATYPVTERFRVTGGVRHSTDDNSQDYRYGNSQVDPSHPLYDGDSVYDSGLIHWEQSVSSTTYKAGIEFDINEDSLLYAQLATGFKNGGLNNTAPPAEYEPEELDAWEFGSKNRFLNDRIQLNLEAYYYKYTNMQAQFPSPTVIADTGDMGFAMLLLNAEEGTNKGVDVEFDYLITQNDKLRMTLSYIDSAYGKLDLPPNPLAGYMQPFPLEGRQVAMSPEWSGSFEYEHTWVLENGDTVTGRFDTKISDGYPTTAEQYLAGWWQESYTRSNMSVYYRTADGKWTVGAWANNLENDAQTIFIVPLYRRFSNEPRTFGMNVSFRY